MRTLPHGLAALLMLTPALPAAPEGDSSATQKPQKPVVAVYDLEDALSEGGKGSSSLLSMDASRPLTLFDLSKSLGRARADGAVKAVVLDVDGAELDFSQLQEVRNHLLALRKAGKDVWMYSESLTNGTALLGSAANHFTLMPEADCSFHGIFAESMYYKGLLDKVGVKADVIHIGDFKSFGETYYRTGPSDYAKQQQDKLLDSIFAQLVESVATGRNLTEEKVRGLIDDGSLNAQRAVEAGLADHLLHRTDFVKKLRETYGKDAVFNRKYQLPNLDGPEIEGMMDIFQLMFQKDQSAKSTKDFVAVVALDGDISDESVAPVRSQVLKLVKDDHAKALVLRVNSPGGSALASEVLWEAIDEWKQTKRPLVVSMGGVAASGGYYVSCGADRIFAEPGTITGSIGVVGMKFVLGDAMAKVGITTHATQRGKNAGLSSMAHAYTPDEADTIRKSMEEVYGTFKKRVTDGRGAALKGDLEPLAGGRVYSGKDALAIGLVDELGGLSDAIVHAKKESKAEKLDVRFLPEPKSMLEGMFAKPDKNDDEIVRAGKAPSPGAALREALARTGLMDTLPPNVRRGVSRLATRMDTFRNSKVLMLGPELEINW
ncbi:MAG: signal peptide peptidase SppA [Verrucomicrobia bacterium]|nr:signal peptide peptidase SppA [Verrucomicrobiota bacterium]